jgi:GrpB-like predicted nucleotidyltransferase (UPF0157 family)
MRIDLTEPGDYRFIANLFDRLPKEIANPGRSTRFVGYEGPRHGARQPYFLGLEVESVETIPAGMKALILGDHTLTVLEPIDGRAVVTWEDDLTWMWRDESASRDHTKVTGEFAATVPTAWRPSGSTEPIPFSVVSNCFFHPAIAGADDEINLVAYDSTWPKAFSEFSNWLSEQLGSGIALSIEHIGSTSIPGMPAKPIIDVLVEVPSFGEAKRRALPLFNDETWEYWWYHDHMTFIKRDGFGGPRTHHVHMMPRGRDWQARVAFRDYLKTHDRDALRYKELKRTLAEKHKTDRERYTTAKSAFVAEIVGKAMQGAQTLH